MKALSIRQPWAWLILHAGKDIENRSWPTSFRGRILIHAGKGMTRDEYAGANDFLDFVEDHDMRETVPLPPLKELERGGIVGAVNIVGCVSEHDSPWFVGDYGFLLRDPQVLPFRPWRGELGFFDVPYELSTATPKEPPA